MRKYLSEFGLINVSNRGFLLQLGDLDLAADADVHIYLICRQPRISVDPESFSATDTTISLTFIKQVRDNQERISITTPHTYGSSEVRFSTSYPYTTLRIEGPDGRHLAGNCALIASTLGAVPRDLEVLYVGQAYGGDGSRNAVERLKSHSTLQNIYAEALRLSPDQEIWLLLLPFEEQIIGSFDGTQPYAASSQGDAAHVAEVLAGPISAQQSVNFTEAAMIRYFQPPYNHTYKNTFPSPAHATYRDCYDLDLNMVCAEIHAFDFDARLWSETIEPSDLHFCMFELHSRSDRVAMFDFQ